jgi:hypothetical protein
VRLHFGVASRRQTADSGAQVARGQHSSRRALDGIEPIKKNAPDAKVEDLTD